MLWAKILDFEIIRLLINASSITEKVITVICQFLFTRLSTIKIKANEKKENLEKDESDSNKNLKRKEKSKTANVVNKLSSEKSDNLNLASVDFKEKENSQIPTQNLENVKKISIKNPNGKKEEWKVKN